MLPKQWYLWENSLCLHSLFPATWLSQSYKRFLHGELRELYQLLAKLLQRASGWGGGGTDEREVSNKMYSMQQIFKKVTCFGVQLDWTWTVWENNYVYVPRRSISPNISVFGSGIVWPFCAFPSHCAPVYKTAVFNGEPKSSRTHPKSRTHPNLRKVFNSIMLIVHACLHWATF